jgi:(p)ppGpp synthase/HD superfamily hydrolase
MASARFSPDLYMKALHFAADAHGAQKVPGSERPYLVHVCSVAAEVIAALEAERHERPDLAVPCALLHDVVEDTPVALDRIEAEFGAEVAAGVSALTKDSSKPKEEQMVDSLARIREQPEEIWMVKLADRLTNLQPPPAHWSPEKCRRYRVEAEAILDALGAASDVLAGRFRHRLTEYKRFED